VLISEPLADIIDAQGYTFVVTEINFSNVPVQMTFAAMLIYAFHAALENRVLL
jgi:hypothetical protein